MPDPLDLREILVTEAQVGMATTLGEVTIPLSVSYTPYKNLVWMVFITELHHTVEFWKFVMAAFQNGKQKRASLYILGNLRYYR